MHVYPRRVAWVQSLQINRPARPRFHAADVNASSVSLRLHWLHSLCRLQLTQIRTNTFRGFEDSFGFRRGKRLLRPQVLQLEHCQGVPAFARVWTH